MLEHTAFRGFAEVVPHVPPTGTLGRVRHTSSGAFGIDRGTVATDDLDAVAVGEPGGECVGVPVGQQVDRAAGVPARRRPQCARCCVSVA